jgi:hypothetical protein
MSCHFQNATSATREDSSTIRRVVLEKLDLIMKEVDKDSVG